MCFIVPARVISEINPIAKINCNERFFIKSVIKGWSIFNPLNQMIGDGTSYIPICSQQKWNRLHYPQLQCDPVIGHLPDPEHPEFAL